MKYENIPEPTKIIAIAGNKIFFKTADKQVLVFDANKLNNAFGPNKITQEIMSNINSVKVDDGFFVFGDQYLGKDTIIEFSHKPDWEEFAFLIEHLKNSKQVSSDKLSKALAEVV